MAKRIFVYDLPYPVRKSLCQILDANSKWKDLGGEHMGFEYTYLQCIGRRESPTDSLLTEWGNQNHTVTDLFALLSRMQHYQAMSLLKEFVDEQYHHLLREGEELMSKPSPGSNSLSVEKTSTSRRLTNGSEFVATDGNGSLLPTKLLHIKDNKDLGLNLQNINLNGEKSNIKPCNNKTVNEVKIQNSPADSRRQNLDRNSIKQGQTLNNQNPQEKKCSVATTNSSLEACLPRIEYTELETATNGWDSLNILGKGGFGIVYKGTWKNTTVAIKKLDTQKDHQLQTHEGNSNQMPPSMRELKYLSSHRHDNILPLYGYSITDNLTCLVYQYMANGSLEDHLHGKPNGKLMKLNWAQRFNIMTGTARGIQFLHSLTNPPLVHGDIKSANILLDSIFEPRLGDFGLAREGPMQQYTHVTVSSVHGTRPYLPPEFMRSKKFSVKVDTYSFGVVLFEVATGLRAYDESRKEKYLRDHVVYFSGDVSKLADPSVPGSDFRAAENLLNLGKNCVNTKASYRPNMASVLSDVEMLYDIYKKAVSEACGHLLTPSTPPTPWERQIQYDRQFAPVVLGNNSGLPQPIHLPQTLSIQPPSTTTSTSPVLQLQVVLANNSGLPQPIHLPQALSIQLPSTTTSTSPVLQPQVNNVEGCLESSEIPLLSLLKCTSQGSKTQQCELSKDVQDGSDSSKNEQPSINRMSDNNQQQVDTSTVSDFPVSLPSNMQSSDFPLTKLQ